MLSSPNHYSVITKHIHFCPGDIRIYSYRVHEAFSPYDDKYFSSRKNYNPHSYFFLMEKQGHFLAFGKSLRLCGQILEACTMWVWRSHSRSSPTFSYFFNQLHVRDGTCFQCLSFNLKISLPFSINAHWGQFLGCLNPLSWFNGVSNLLREHYI